MQINLELFIKYITFLPIVIYYQTFHYIQKFIYILLYLNNNKNVPDIWWLARQRSQQEKKFSNATYAGTKNSSGIIVNDKNDKF